MANRNEILAELQSVSALVAGIAPVTPYKVPEGYFEQLTRDVILMVQDEKSSDILQGASTNPYTVPEDYFREFHVQMLARVQNEKSRLELGLSTPYSVPAGYFDNLAGEIMDRIKANNKSSVEEELETLSPLLSKLDKKMPFSMPEGYFEELGETVMTGTRAIDFVNDELEKHSPLMGDLKSKNVYSIPVGYFDNLPSQLLAKVKEKQPAKVVKMDFRNKFLKYAAAAVVAGVIILAGFLFINKPGGGVSTDNMVAQADDKLQQEAQGQVKLLSDDELARYIDDQTSPLQELLNFSNSDLSSEDVKMMLADVPDDELKQYLEDYSGGSETITN